MTNDQWRMTRRAAACSSSCFWSLVIGHWPFLPTGSSRSRLAIRVSSRSPDASGFKTSGGISPATCATAEAAASGISSLFPPRAPSARRASVGSIALHCGRPQVRALRRDRCASGRFHFTQRISRGAFGEAGFGGERLAWIEDLAASATGAECLPLRGERSADERALRRARRKTVDHPRRARDQPEGRRPRPRPRIYYSGTRLPTAGELTLEGRAFAVTGESWFDHEWATNQLTPEQTGWNWFSLQLSDGTGADALPYAHPRRGPRPNSSGTFIAADGATRHLRREDYTLTPRSPSGRAKPPAGGIRSPGNSPSPAPGSRRRSPRRSRTRNWC